MTGISGLSWVGPGKPNLQFELRWKAGGSARVTTGPKRPHRGVCPGPNIPLKGRQGSRVSIPDSPGDQALPRGEAEDSTFLSSRDTDLLEPTEWTQGCRASSSVWREDSGLLSRPGRKRRPSSRDDGGVSWVSSGCCAHGGFLTRHDEDLREPLVRRQGSQVSMRMARGSWSSLSSHGKRLGPQEALKKDSRGLSRVAAGNPRFPRLLQGTLGNFPGCL